MMIQIDNSHFVLFFFYDMGKISLRGPDGLAQKLRICLPNDKFDVKLEEERDETIYHRHYWEHHSPLLIRPKNGSLKEIPIELNASWQKLGIKLNEKLNLKWEIRIFPSGVLSCRLYYSINGKTHFGRTLTLSDIGKMMCILRRKNAYGIIPSSTHPEIDACRDSHELAKAIVTKTLQMADVVVKPRYEYTGLEYPYPIALITDIKSEYASAQDLLNDHKLEIANILSTSLCYTLNLNETAVKDYTSNNLSIDMKKIFLFKFPAGLILSLGKLEEEKTALLHYEAVLKTVEIALAQGFALNAYDTYLDKEIAILTEQVKIKESKRIKEMISRINDLKIEYGKDKEELSGSVEKLLGSVSHQNYFREVSKVRQSYLTLKSIEAKLETVEKILTSLEEEVRREQDARVNSTMLILSLIFSGAVGLSIADLMQKAWIVSGWPLLVIGITFWLLIASIGIKIINRTLRKVM